MSSFAKRKNLVSNYEMSYCLGHTDVTHLAPDWLKKYRESRDKYLDVKLSPIGGY